MRALKKLCKRFDEATARIDRVILLAGAVGDDFLARDAEEFFSDEDFETIEGCFGPLPEHVKEGIEADDIGAVSEWLFREGKLGFLVQVATPVMKPTGPKSFQYSWGHYIFKWVYGDTLNDAMSAGFAWIKEQRKKEREQAKGTANAAG